MERLVRYFHRTSSRGLVRLLPGPTFQSHGGAAPLPKREELGGGRPRMTGAGSRHRLVAGLLVRRLTYFKFRFYNAEQLCQLCRLCQHAVCCNF
jgi:hypothetical protein